MRRLKPLTKQLNSTFTQSRSFNQLTPSSSLSSSPLFKPNNKLYFRSNTYLFRQKQQTNDEYNKKQNERKANLGTLIQMLQVNIPNLLHNTVPSEFISSNIILRILPTQYPNLPVIKGSMVYSTTVKAIQLCLTSFYLNPNVKLHITNIKVNEPVNSLSSDELINLSIDNNLIESDNCQNKQELSNLTTKVIIKWRTCLSGCPHLNNNKTTSARLGSYQINGLEILNYLNLHIPLGFNHDRKNVTEKQQTQQGQEAHQFQQFNSTKDLNDTERIVTGVFIFELNENNDKIIVHTVDNCDIIESTETSEQENRTEDNGIGFAPGT